MIQLRICRDEDMDDIKRVQLSEIAELITKGTTPTTLGYEFQDSGVNFLKIECFDENGAFVNSKVAHISEECHEKLKRSQLKNGDILFSIAGAIGRVAIVTEEMLPANTNQALAIIRIADENVYLPYIKLILTSPIVKEQFEKKKQGVAQLNLSLKDINEISIPLPSKEKQIELAELFGKVANVIAKRNKELHSLDSLIKARFVELFGDLTSNPYGWKTFTLEECFDITSSKRILKSEWKEQGIPFLRVRDMVQLATTGRLDNEFFVSEEFYESLSDSDGVPQKGDILVSATSTLGKCHVVDVEERFYFKDADVLRFRAKRAINPIFFMEQMKNAYIEEQIARTLGVTTVAHFTIKAAKIINMRCPDIELQEEFADFVKQADKSKVVFQL